LSDLQGPSNVSMLDQIKAEVSTAITQVRLDFGDEVANLKKFDRYILGGLVGVAGLVVIETKALAQLMKGVGQLAQTVGEIASALQQGQAPVVPQTAAGPVPSNGRHGYDPGPQEVPEEVKTALRDTPNVVPEEFNAEG
jgi:hypothetical protein